MGMTGILTNRSGWAIVEGSAIAPLTWIPQVVHRVPRQEQEARIGVCLSRVGRIAGASTAYPSTGPWPMVPSGHAGPDTPTAADATPSATGQWCGHKEAGKPGTEVGGKPCSPVTVEDNAAVRRNPGSNRRMFTVQEVKLSMGSAAARWRLSLRGSSTKGAGGAWPATI